MTELDLFESIGNIDDDIIEKANQKKATKKKLIIMIGSIAACIAAVLSSVIIAQVIQSGSEFKTDNPFPESSVSEPSGNAQAVTPVSGTSSSEASDAGDSGAVSPVQSSAEAHLSAPEGSSAPETSENTEVTSGASEESTDSSEEEVSPAEGSEQMQSSEQTSFETSEEIAVEWMNFDIYKVVDGRLVSTQIYSEATSDKIFEAWKKENSIGDDVKLISVDITDNGTVEYSGFGGEEVAIYTMGDYSKLTVIVSKTLENYYGAIDKDLLLESLEKTMRGMSDVNEYELILSDAEPEESESNHVDPNDLQYNDQGEILE